MIRRIVLASLLALMLGSSVGATDLVANIPITAPGLIASGTLKGALTNAFVSVDFIGPIGGILIVDVFISADNGATWIRWTGGRFEGGAFTSHFGARLGFNTASTLFRIEIREVTGGTWTAVNATITS